MTVNTVQANCTVADFLCQNRPQFQRWAQFHVHIANQVFFSQQGQSAAINGMFPENLSVFDTQVDTFDEIDDIADCPGFDFDSTWSARVGGAG